MEEALQLGFPDHIITADIGDGQTVSYMLVQILDNLAHPGHIAVLGVDPGGRRYKMCVILWSQAPEYIDKHKLQRDLYDLLASKRGLSIAAQFADQGIVKRCIEGLSGLRDQLSQIEILRSINRDDLVFEEIHTRSVTLEGDYNKVRRNLPVSPQSVEFIGLVEDHLALFQKDGAGAGRNLYISKVYKKKLPEVMRFAFVHKVLGIFKIVDRIDVLNGQFFSQCNAFIFFNHNRISLLCLGSHQPLG